MKLDNLLNKNVSRKKSLSMLGISIATFVLSAKGVLGKMLFRNNSGETFEIITTNSPDATVSVKDVRTVNDGNITRNGDGLLSSVVMGDRTITINRDINDVIIGYEDANYEWSLTRNVDNNITDWSVVEK